MFISVNFYSCDFFSEKKNNMMKLHVCIYNIHRRCMHHGQWPTNRDQSHKYILEAALNSRLLLLTTNSGHQIVGNNLISDPAQAGYKNKPCLSVLIINCWVNVSSQLTVFPYRKDIHIKQIHTESNKHKLWKKWLSKSNLIRVDDICNDITKVVKYKNPSEINQVSSRLRRSVVFFYQWTKSCFCMHFRW